MTLEPKFRKTAQDYVKENLLATRFNEEPVTYGQALVTYQFLQSQQPQQSLPDNQIARQMQT